MWPIITKSFNLQNGLFFSLVCLLYETNIYLSSGEKKTSSNNSSTLNKYLQTFIQKHTHQLLLTTHKRFFFVNTIRCFTYLSFYISYMYMLNPNTAPSPIRDYLIMFTLAKMIYQNVTRKVIRTKTSFIAKKNGFEMLFISL